MVDEDLFKPQLPVVVLKIIGNLVAKLNYLVVWVLHRYQRADLPQGVGYQRVDTGCRSRIQVGHDVALTGLKLFGPLRKRACVDLRPIDIADQRIVN